MNFQESIQTLYSLINYEKTDFSYNDLKLDRMREFMSLLKRPDTHSPVILVAGTKGKGSTCYYLERILASQQKKCGLYVKPHLLTFRERLQFNGEIIQPEELAKLVTEIFPVIDYMEKHSLYGKPTYFEVSVALAFQYFKKRNADFSIMEVGLGGRLDATNVADPILTIITPISYDHTEILGKTIPKIAREKAGILRPNIPLILGLQEKKAAKTTIMRIAEHLRVPVFPLENYYSYQILNRSAKGSVFEMKSKSGREGTFSLPLLGDQQVENFLTALLSAEHLGYSPSNQQLQNLLNEAVWPGRIQIIHSSPLTIFDVAHNQASFATLCHTLRDYLGIRKAIFLLGFLTGKDFPGIAKELSQIDSQVILTTPFNPKAALPADIVHFFIPHIPHHKVINDPYQAWEKALQYATEYRLPLVVAGSFYLAKLLSDKLNVTLSKEEVEL
ncbi:MAG: bifunctional folylpolyglutamate synthase/dihydrofolate synthase [Candidatus Atribacteria bacterium]|nr:bifunctional folylpolyglutamate synthase/dihydrofolate synthase [Candidatus Atribacteria bacterium]